MREGERDGVWLGDGRSTDLLYDALGTQVKSPQADPAQYHTTNQST